jgi:DNA-binding NarL/FixJ family response regulator
MTGRAGGAIMRLMPEHTPTTVRRRLRLALEFAGSVQPRSLPSRRDRLTDAALAVLIVLAAALTAHSGGDTVALLIAVALLAARRRYPLAACVLLVMEVLATRYHAMPIAPLIVVFAGYSAVAYSRFRGAALVTVPWLWVIVGTSLWGTTALLILVSLALTVTVGYAVHAVGERDRMLAEHEAATRRALELERARITSELHDVVTHSVSVMIVQAGAARQVLAEAPGEARAAMLAVEASGRAAMTELRHLLGLLSPIQSPSAEAGSLDGTAPVELEPQPGLAQLQSLVDRLTAAGLPIDLRVGELPHELSPGLDRRPGALSRRRRARGLRRTRRRDWRPMSDPATPPRVVIADDQALVRSGFRMIHGAAGIPVVGEAADGGQALAAVREHRPDLALMDIRMPGMDGLEATRRILAEPAGAGCRIIILTTFDLDQYVYAALTAGASGFLLKDVSPEQLVDAVRTVRSGDALLAPSITRRLVERFTSAAAAPPAVHGDLSELTPRELEVLQLLARGLSNAELAAELVLSEATVKTHVARILRKLGLRDRVQAVVLAYQTGAAAPTGTGN